MAVAFVDSAKFTYDVDIAGNPGPTQQWAIPVPSSEALVAGDLIVAHYSLDSSGSDPARSLPSGWVSITGIQHAGTGTTTVHGEAMYHVVTTAEAASPPSSWTLDLGAAFEGSVSVARYRGVDTGYLSSVPEYAVAAIGLSGMSTIDRIGNGWNDFVFNDATLVQGIAASEKILQYAGTSARVNPSIGSKNMGLVMVTFTNA